MHGGINGLAEALLRAVPVVVIPIFADQFRNGRNVEKRGVGKVLLKLELSEDTIRSTIQEILDNDSYKQNALRIAKLMREKPFSAEQRLVEWTNFAVANGVLDVLHVEGSRLNFIVYFNLDVIAAVVVSVCLILIIIIKMCRAITKLMREKPFSAEQRLVEWTNFAVANGVLDVLHVEGSRLNFIVYFNLDVIAAVVVSVCLILVIIIKMCRAISRHMFMKKLKQN
ncbi:unnamed protein product [Strongylus vulgaris]|uniref:glucuronosyltransferase n=1 Tax=Strongylus vulgaris TaxID=40348 RepID=A0A3P7LPX3_STRVU|nr:unnamed protein product [Strongylus vulgaris]